MSERYTKYYRNLVIQRICSAPRRDIPAIITETGVSRATLYRWAKEAELSNRYDIKAPLDITLHELIKLKRPQDWSAEEKLALVLEGLALSEENLAGFLRSRGLNQQHFHKWRKQMLFGLRQSRPAHSKKNAIALKQLKNNSNNSVINCENCLNINKIEFVSPPEVATRAPDLSLKKAMAKLERDFICRALALTGGNRTQAAIRLDISLRNLQYKIREFGLENYPSDSFG